MNVAQVIALTQEWVEVHGSQTPGFCGAHLMGGILAMPKDSFFPLHNDVDFNIVLRGNQEFETHDIFYNGLILEYSTVGSEYYRSPEAVLSNPQIASNLAVDSILSDPVGLLQPLHAVVKRQYLNPTWVKARCTYEKNLVMQSLEELHHAASPFEAILPLSFAIVYLAGLLTIADLRPPTHRRALILMRDVLHQQMRAELLEEALCLLGYAHLTHQQVEVFLQDVAITFDRAVEVKRTASPFEFKLQSHVRPYLVDGLQELIQEGNHREIMLWITLVLLLSNTTIQQDAPESEKPFFQAKLDRLFQEIGFDAPNCIESRLQGAKELADKLFTIADEMLGQRAEL
ncbi:MAG: hypothetical protein JOZ18_03130 [Chloroflexi bacterium]|nr:hypothetical protein [Chloroflexota bacterium]